MTERGGGRLILGLMAAGGVLVLSWASTACRNAPAPTAAGADDPRAGVARLQRANALLQRQLELAAGKDFYLVLDPSAGSMTLMLKGARLQQFSVRGLQVGHPRVSWVDSRDPRHVEDVVWARGELDPPRLLDRLVIQAAPPAKEGTGQAGKEAEPAAPPIPPTPEELYPVPSRYHIRFADGLSVEVRPRESDKTVGRWARLRASRPRSGMTSGRRCAPGVAMRSGCASPSIRRTHSPSIARSRRRFGSSSSPATPGRRLVTAFRALAGLLGPPCVTVVIHALQS